MRARRPLGAMREAWWVPTLEIPGDEVFGRPARPLVLAERTLPRSIMVNRQGSGSPTKRRTTTPSAARSTQFDPIALRLRQPAVLAHVRPWPPPAAIRSPSRPAAACPSWLAVADSLDDLARADRRRARRASPPLSRGATSFVSRGPRRRLRPGRQRLRRLVRRSLASSAAMRRLGRSTEPPYHAVESIAAPSAPKAGRDRRRRAGARPDGAPIAGLYAAGNAMAAATGMVYGGAGGTLGPAIVFGYRAGRAAATRDRPA